MISAFVTQLQQTTSLIGITGVGGECSKHEKEEKLVQILSLESATPGEILTCRLTDNIKRDPN